MKRKILLLSTIILLALPITLLAQMTYVPDDNFEQALIYLGLDTPPLNDSIPTKNIDTVTYLEIQFKDIYELIGIEDFKALDSLLITNSKITNLNLSENPSLIKLYCPYNKLKSINIKKNILLEVLDCTDNQLTSLDIGNNPLMITLICGYNKINNLDLTSNKYLSYLFCYRNNLLSLNISTNNVLDYLDSRENPNLNCIQVADSTKATNNPYWYKDPTAHYSENCNYTGVEDNKFENEAAAISPNPAQDYIEISLPPRPPGEGRGEGIRIYNMLGEIVSGLDTPPDPLFLEGGKCRIDVSGLVPGVYFVRLGNVVQKFIKM